jgi:hypothetical protein
MKPVSSLTGRQQVPLFSPAVAIILAYDVQALLTKLLGGLLPPELPLAARARVCARVQRLDNAHFTVLPLVLPDGRSP